MRFLNLGVKGLTRKLRRIEMEDIGEEIMGPCTYESLVRST